MSELTPGKRLLFSAVLLLLVLTVVEVGAFVLARVGTAQLGFDFRRTPDIYAEQSERIRRLLDEDGAQREVLDPVLGWRYRAGYENDGDRINAQGLRSDREYPSSPEPGVMRIAAFGDSFVYGNEVGNSDSWAAVLEQAVPQWEVLNFGVGGYGTDQAYLRYLHEGRAVAPDLVLIGFVPVNVRRNVNVYRRFLSGREWALTKPRFVLDDAGELAHVPNPLRHEAHYQRLLEEPGLVRRLGPHDHWYRPAIYENPLYDVSAAVRVGSVLWNAVRERYLSGDRLLVGGQLNAASSAFALQARLLEEFASSASAAGSVPIVVLFPDRDSIERVGRGETVSFAPLMRRLQAIGVDFVDLTSEFAARHHSGDVDAWFMPGDHYSPEGNRIVAEGLEAEIRARMVDGAGNVDTTAMNASVGTPGS